MRMNETIMEKLVEKMIEKMIECRKIAPFKPDHRQASGTVGQWSLPRPSEANRNLEHNRCKGLLVLNET